jgi:hypothetical protein
LGREGDNQDARADSRGLPASAAKATRSSSDGGKCGVCGGIVEYIVDAGRYKPIGPGVYLAGMHGVRRYVSEQNALASYTIL